MLLELIQKNWHLIKPEDGKQKCTRTVWVQIGAELKKAGSSIKNKRTRCMEKNVVRNGAIYRSGINAEGQLKNEPGLQLQNTGNSMHLSKLYFVSI